MLVVVLCFFALLMGATVMIVAAHSRAMKYANGQEVMHRLVAGTHVLERSIGLGSAEDFIGWYETRTYNSQSLTLDATTPPPAMFRYGGGTVNNNSINTLPIAATVGAATGGITLSQEGIQSKATVYSNLTRSYVTLTELSKRINNSCGSISTGIGFGMSIISICVLVLFLLAGNFVASRSKAGGAALSYGGVLLVPTLFMIALICVISGVLWECEVFERGERLRMTVEFQADLFSSLSSLKGQTSDAVTAIMEEFVQSVNTLQLGKGGGGSSKRSMLLVRRGATADGSDGILVGRSLLVPSARRLLVSLGTARTDFHIVDTSSYRGLLAKGYHRESGLWLVVQEDMPAPSNQLSHPFAKGGLVVGLVGSIVLSLVAAITLPFPSFGVTKGQQAGMTPTSDISPAWPFMKMVCFTLMGIIVAIITISNLALPHHISRFYDEARQGLVPLLAAYRDLQAVSINTAMIVANASLGQEWDVQYEAYPRLFVNESKRQALIEEQETIRAITADYIDRYGPLGVYQAGYGTNYPPFLETSAARTFLASLAPSGSASPDVNDLVLAASLYINRAELAFLTLLLTQDMSFEVEMLYWLGLIVSEGVGEPAAASALVSSLTSITSPVRTAVSQVSLTDARSQIVRLAAEGTITNATHAIYREFLAAVSAPVSSARDVIRAQLAAPSSELYFQFVKVCTAVGVSCVIMLGLVASFDSWYTPAFLARKSTSAVPMTIGLTVAGCICGIIAITGGAAAISRDIADMSSSVEDARRVFELVPKSLRLLDTAARSLAEWLLVLQMPTALSLNHAMAIDGALRDVLQALVDAFPDASDPRAQFILDLTSDLCDTLNSIFAVVARDYRDPTLPLADVATAMDALYRTANQTLMAGTVGKGTTPTNTFSASPCGCATLSQTEANTATVLEMARSVILRSASLWALPTAAACCSDASTAVNQLYRRAMAYMQVEAVDEGALTTTDMATLTMRATNLLSRMQREISAFQNSIITDRHFTTRNWVVGFWLPTVMSWGMAIAGGFVLKFTGHELDSATK